MREIGVLDPIEAGAAELWDDALAVGTDMIDAWRTEHLLIPAVTRTVFSLVSGTQSYSIGSAGTVSVDYPAEILSWSIIPDDDATDPIEIPMGRPLTTMEWQGIRIKTQDGRPSSMWFDHRFAANLGLLYFHPIPNDSDFDAVIYCLIPELVSLVAATSYNLRPGYAEAIKTNLALRLCPRHGRRASVDFPELVATAKEAKAKLKRGNIRVEQAGIRREFAIGQGQGRRTFNVYTGGPS